MKKSFVLIAALAVLCAIPTMASAGSWGERAFQLMSSASAAIKTSDPISVRGFVNKTVTVSGATLTSNATTTAYKNYSGTYVVEGGPTVTGPWTTTKQSQLASTPAVSAAAQQSSASVPHTISWQDSVAYIRVKWTGGTVGGKLKAWLNWND